jgi:hypothetical protein
MIDEIMCCLSLKFHTHTVNISMVFGYVERR